jgi:hypothetical protein
VTNILGDTEPTECLGYAKFVIDGQEIHLEAVDEGGATSSTSEIELRARRLTRRAGSSDTEPPKDGKIVIDLTRATTHHRLPPGTRLAPFRWLTIGSKLRSLLANSALRSRLSRVSSNRFRRRPEWRPGSLGHAHDCLHHATSGLFAFIQFAKLAGQPARSPQIGRESQPAGDRLTTFASRSRSDQSLLECRTERKLKRRR